MRLDLQPAVGVLHLHFRFVLDLRVDVEVGKGLTVLKEGVLLLLQLLLRSLLPVQRGLNFVQFDYVLYVP